MLTGEQLYTSFYTLPIFCHSIIAMISLLVCHSMSAMISLLVCHSMTAMISLLVCHCISAMISLLVCHSFTDSFLFESKLKKNWAEVQAPNLEHQICNFQRGQMVLYFTPLLLVIEPLSYGTPWIACSELRWPRWQSGGFLPGWPGFKPRLVQFQFQIVYICLLSSTRLRVHWSMRSHFNKQIRIINIR